MNHMSFLTSYMIGRMRRVYFMAIPETKQDFKKSRICYTIGDSAAQTIAQLAGGTFIATLLSYNGVSDANIGIITSLASLAALSQLFAMRFTKGLKKCKLFVCFTVLQRILLAAIFFVPFFPWNLTTKVVVIVASYFIAQICVQIGTPVTQDWLASLVPSRLRGRYLAIKDSVAVFVVAFTMLVAGVILDLLKKENLLLAFLIIGSMIFLLVVINVVSFSFMKEPKISYLNQEGKEMHGILAKRAKHAEQVLHNETKEGLLKEFKSAFGSKRFCKAFLLNCLYLTSFYIASPFNASYQIKELGLSYTYIMVIGFISNLLRISITPRMGKLGDKYGMARVLKYTLLSLGISYLIIAFTPPDSAYIMFAMSSVFSGFGWSFIGIGLFGIQLEFLTRERRMSQLTILLSLSGLYGFFISYLGGRLLDMLQSREWYIGNTLIYGQRVLNLAGFLFMLAAVAYTKFVVQREKTEVNHDDGKVTQ